MRKERYMHLLLVISYCALLILLMPETKIAAVQTAAALVLGTVWILWKKPQVRQTKPNYITVFLTLSLVGYSGLRFYYVWRLYYRIRMLADALHMPVDLLVMVTSCILSVCSVPFLLFILQRTRESLEDLSEKQPLKRDLLLIGLAAVAAVCISQCMSDAAILSMGFFKLICGSVPVAAVILILYCLCRRVRVSAAVGTGIFMLIDTVNAYVYRFRDRLLEPTDLFSAGTAMNVAQNYSLWPVPLSVVLGWVFWGGFLIFLFSAVSGEKGRLSAGTRIAVSACCIVSIVLISVYASGIKIYHWENQGARYNGFILDLLSKIKELYVAEPEGYSEDILLDLTEKYAENEPYQSSGKNPHIIVIMDEAFSDLGALGNIPVSTEVMPFINSLDSNTVSGNVLVSVYGGNTANSEFEFLTGHSMAWFSPNAVPYQQYLRSASYSMVSYLKSAFGYRCIAMHPFESSGWNRPAAYASLGFDECLFEQDFPQKDYVRRFISDRELFETVASTYERESDESLFLFCISMQNHGDYSYNGEDFNQTVSLNGFENGYPDAEQFLSLIHETDKAAEYLISYFSEVDDEVVIVFFGDHQPRLADGFYRELGLNEQDSLDEQQKRFVVPFFIWTNYDMEEKHIGLTSLNYLSSYVYRAAGLPLPPYNRFLTEMELTVPAINSNGFLSKRTNGFLTFDAASAEEQSWLTNYRILQYNCMFDERDRVGSFFPVPVN